MYNQIDSNKRSSIFLILGFFVILGALGYVIGLSSGYPEYAYFGVAIAIIFSLISASVSYFAGDKIALASTGAKRIEKADNPYVYRMVENLCITAGVPAPRVYIIDDP